MSDIRNKKRIDGRESVSWKSSIDSDDMAHSEKTKKTSEKPAKILEKRSSAFPPVLILILVLGLVIRLVLLFTESRVYVDGVHYLLQGENIRHGIWDTWDPNGGRWTVPPLYPILVAIFRGFIPDLIRAGQAVSMVVSMILIYVLFLVGRSFIGEKGGLWAAFIISIDPLFTHYSIVTYAEPVFMTATMLCVWYSIVAIEKTEKSYPPVLMGIFAALAYLSKAFGIALAIWGAVILLYHVYNSRGSDKPLKFRAVGLYTASFLIITIPYWIFLTSYLGHFAFDGKSQFEFTRLHAPTLAQERIDPRYEGIITDDYQYAIFDGEPQFGRRTGFEFAKNYVRKYFQKLVEVFIDYPIKQVPPYANVRLTLPLMLLLLGLGLFAIPLSLSTSKTPSILLAWFPLWLFIAPLSFIEVRYYVPFIPLLVPFMARGMVHIEDWMKNTFMFHQPESRIVIIPVLAIVLLLFSAPSNAYRLTHHDEKFDEYRLAGQYLKNHGLEPNEKIVESANLVSFYAGMEGWVTPETNYNGLISFMLMHGIRYVAIDENLTMIKHRRDELRPLFVFPPIETDELMPIFWNDEMTGHRIVVYELKDEIIKKFASK